MVWRATSRFPVVQYTLLYRKVLKNLWLFLERSTNNQKVEKNTCQLCRRTRWSGRQFWYLVTRALMRAGHLHILWEPIFLNGEAMRVDSWKIFNFFFLPGLTNSEVMIVDYCKSRSSAFSRSPLTFFLWGMNRPVAGFWDIWSGLRLIATIASKLEAACVLNDGNICHVHWDMSWFSKRYFKAHVKCERSFRIAWSWL